MASLYREDLAYIQAAGFGAMAERAAPEIVRLLRSAGIPIRRVLDLGCGAGVLARALVAAGFHVTAVDDSADLLTVAAATAPGATFVRSSIYRLELPACEAIVALGEPLTYHADPARADCVVQDFFERAAGALPSGGLLLFDIIETGEPRLDGRSWASGDDWAVMSETTEDQSSRTLSRTIETFRSVGDLYRRGREVHRVRLFDAEELAAWLTVRGFTVVTAQAYGAEPLAPRRRAFLCTRV